MGNKLVPAEGKGALQKQSGALKKAEHTGGGVHIHIKGDGLGRKALNSLIVAVSAAVYGVYIKTGQIRQLKIALQQLHGNRHNQHTAVRVGAGNGFQKAVCNVVVFQINRKILLGIGGNDGGKLFSLYRGQLYLTNGDFSGGQGEIRILILFQPVCGKIFLQPQCQSLGVLNNAVRNTFCRSLEHKRIGNMRILSLFGDTANLNQLVAHLNIQYLSRHTLFSPSALKKSKGLCNAKQSQSLL